MHGDLFIQAKTLARLDTRKPKQANLRRAVSSAYYAVFHYLVHESRCMLFGSQHAQKPFRSTLGRAFTHSVMRQACVSFGSGTLKEAVIKSLPRDFNGNYPVDPAIANLASSFVEIQGKRHLADYDRGEHFNRLDVLTLIDETQKVVSDFDNLPQTDEKKFFLACLWAWKELANR